MLAVCYSSSLDKLQNLRTATGIYEKGFGKGKQVKVTESHKGTTGVREFGDEGLMGPWLQLLRCAVLRSVVPNLSEATTEVETESQREEEIFVVNEIFKLQ